MRLMLLLVIAAIGILLMTQLAGAQALPLPSDTLMPTMVFLAPAGVNIAPALRGQIAKANHAVTESILKSYGASEQLLEIRDSLLALGPEAKARWERGWNFVRMVQNYDSIFRATAFEHAISFDLFLNIITLVPFVSDRPPMLSIDSSSLDSAYLGAASRRAGVRYAISIPSVNYFQDSVVAKGPFYDVETIDNPDSIPTPIEDSLVVLETFATARVVVYDSQTGHFLLDTTVTSSASHSGFIQCNYGLRCASLNVAAAMMEPVLRVMFLNTPRFQHQIQLRQARSRTLAERYFGRGCDARIAALIPHDSTFPDPAMLYACFTNADTTQIVALAARTVSREEYESPHYGSQIMYRTHEAAPIKDTTYTFVAIIRGARVNGRWFFGVVDDKYIIDSSPDSARIRFLDRLQDYDFFAENDIERSEAFWQSELFARVTDPRVSNPYFDPESDYNRQKLTEYEEFGGMFQFVVEQLQEESKRMVAPK